MLALERNRADVQQNFEMDKKLFEGVIEKTGISNEYTRTFLGDVMSGVESELNFDNERKGITLGQKYYRDKKFPGVDPVRLHAFDEKLKKNQGLRNTYLAMDYVEGETLKDVVESQDPFLKSRIANLEIKENAYLKAEKFANDKNSPENIRIQARRTMLALEDEVKVELPKLRKNALLTNIYKPHMKEIFDQAAVLQDHFLREAVAGSGFAHLDLKGQHAEIELNPKKIELMELRAGEFSIHHPYMLHTSSPNISNFPRVGLVIRYISPALIPPKRPAYAWLVSGKDMTGNWYHVAPSINENSDQLIEDCIQSVSSFTGANYK